MVRNILSVFKRLPLNDRVVVYECRRCGTTVESMSTLCPYCGRGRIARYEIR